MILNDKEIRKLCLVPTHQHVTLHSHVQRHLYARDGNDLYSVDTGHCYDFEDYMSKLKLDELTPEQQRGYATGGGVVPSTDDEWGRMIHPFEPQQVKSWPIFSLNALNDKLRGHIPSEPDIVGQKKVISYGTSSMGYDVRLGRKFKIFTNINATVIDPLNMSEDSYVDREGDFVIIPPNSYVLGHTIEYFRMPEDVVAICVGKSTYARAGCAINVTPIEPGFEGQVVIEIANQTPLPMKVYADMGIAQFMFLRGDKCDISYAARAGKYQGQMGITTARV